MAKPYVNVLEKTPQVGPSATSEPKPVLSPIETVSALLDSAIGEKPSESAPETIDPSAKAPSATRALETSPAPLPAPLAVPVSGSLTLPPRRAGIVEHLDGSFSLDVVIPVEQAEMLRSWASQAGEPLEKYVNEMVMQALLAFCSSQEV